MTLYRNEFPNFPVADMPAIPPGFADYSWRNDPCPCFVNISTRLAIWVDFADPGERENIDGKRYMLQRVDENGCFTDDDPFLETDEWNDILSAIAKETAA